MILTYKVLHCYTITCELAKARLVAEHAIQHRDQRSSKYVKHIGLPAAISNQLLRKYGRNRCCKRISSANIIVPGQAVRYNADAQTISIPCLRMTVPCAFRHTVERVNQIEINARYMFVSVTVTELQPIEVRAVMGVDLNATGHAVVAALPANGKVVMLGKQAQHIHKKYSRLRQRFQKRKKRKKLKQVRHREQNIVRNLNHQMSRAIVNMAHEHGCRIQLEDLAGIRQRAKTASSFRYTLHSWSFAQLRAMIAYKAKLLGIEVVLVDPRYTSQECSRCGRLGNRSGKRFTCPHCGHVAHADVNAAFNIGMRPSVERSAVDKDAADGSTDSPKGDAHTKECAPRTPLVHGRE